MLLFPNKNKNQWKNSYTNSVLKERTIQNKYNIKVSDKTHKNKILQTILTYGKVNN